MKEDEKVRKMEAFFTMDTRNLTIKTEDGYFVRT